MKLAAFRHLNDYISRRLALYYKLPSENRVEIGH